MCSLLQRKQYERCGSIVTLIGSSSLLIMAIFYMLRRRRRAAPMRLFCVIHNVHGPVIFLSWMSFLFTLSFTHSISSSFSFYQILSHSLSILFFHLSTTYLRLLIVRCLNIILQIICAYFVITRDNCICDLNSIVLNFTISYN